MIDRQGVGKAEVMVVARRAEGREDGMAAVMEVETVEVEAEEEGSEAAGMEAVGRRRRRRRRGGGRRWRGGLENLASDVDHVDSAAQQALALRVLNGLADELDRIKDDALRRVASHHREVNGQCRLDWEVRVARIAALRPSWRSGGRSNNHVSVCYRRAIVERKVAKVVLLVLHRRRIKVLGDRAAKDNLSQLPIRRVCHVEVTCKQKHTLV